jgi:hypothetical protein
MPILSLIAKLGLDKSGFDAGMDSAGKKVSRFGADLKSQIAGGFTLAAFAAITRETIAYADELEKLATRLNVTNQEAQQFAIAAKLGGADTEFFAGKWEKLQKAMAGAGGASGNPFEKFGISLDRLKSMNAPKVLQAMADNIQEFGFNADKSIAAMEIFGKGGGKMVNILRDLAQAKSGTLLFSDAEIARLKRADDLMTKLGNNAKVLFANLVGQLSTLKGNMGVLNPLVGMLMPDSDIKNKSSIPDGPTMEVSEEASNAAKAHMKEQDEILKLEEETAKIESRNRFNKLSESEKLNELLKERLTLQENLIDTDPDDIGTAMMRKRLAEVNGEILGAEKKKGDAFSIGESSIGRVGAFTGAASSAAFNASSGQAQLSALIELQRILSTKGIIVKDVKR